MRERPGGWRCWSERGRAGDGSGEWSFAQILAAQHGLVITCLGNTQCIAVGSQACGVQQRSSGGLFHTSCPGAALACLPVLPRFFQAALVLCAMQYFAGGSVYFVKLQCCNLISLVVWSHARAHARFLRLATSLCGAFFRKGFIWAMRGSMLRFAPNDFVKVLSARSGVACGGLLRTIS